MTVLNDTAEWSFNWTGAETGFVLNPGIFLENSHIVVTLRPTSGADVPLTESTHYTLTGKGVANAGTVTVVSFPVTPATVIVERIVPLTQETDRDENINYPESVLETDLDKVVMALQQLWRSITRSLRVPRGETIAEMPLKAARALRLLAFDVDGNPSAGPLTADVTAGATAAAASAAAAAVSASSAAGSATAADGSDTSAAASAAAAAASAADVAALVQNVPALTTATGDGTTAGFTLAQAPVHERALLVTLDGIAQHTDAFSVSGTTLTFTDPPPASVAIEVRDLSSTAIVVATEVSALAAIASAIASVASAIGAVQTVADDLDGDNTIGAAIAAASAAATSATAAATSATAAAGSATAAAGSATAAAGSATAAAASATAAAAAKTASEAAQAAAEAAQTAAEAAQAAAESAKTDAEAAQAAAETAQTAAETAQAAAEAAQAAAETAAAAAASSASAAAASASAAGSAIDAAIRSAFRARHGVLPQSGGLFPFGVEVTDGLALTRATTGRRIDGAGLVESVAIDGVRQAHDPQSGEPLGVLIEPARTNLEIRSEEWDNGARQKLSSMTVTANAGVAPDGTTTADKLVEATGTVGGFQARSTGRTVTTGLHYCYSTWVKYLGETQKISIGMGGSPFDNGLGNSARALVDLATNTITPLHITYGSGGRSGATAFGLEQYPDGWVRVWVTATAVATGPAGEGAVILLSDSASETGGTPNFTGDGSSGVLVWGTQWEEVPTDQSGPSSYIQTVASTVTRSADLAEIDLSAVDAFRPGGYSLVIEAVLQATGGVLAEVHNGSTAEVTLELQDGELHLVDGSSLDLTGATGLAYGDRVVVAIRVTEDDVSIAVNGGAVDTESIFGMSGDSDTLALGADLYGAGGAAAVFGAVAVLGPLSNAKLVEISGG